MLNILTLTIRKPVFKHENMLFGLNGISAFKKNLRKRIFRSPMILQKFTELLCDNFLKICKSFCILYRKECVQGTGLNVYCGTKIYTFHNLTCESLMIYMSTVNI